MDATPAPSACDCALHKFLQGGWSLMVHGVIDMRDGNVSLYLALNTGSIANGHSVERFRGMVGPLITQIDAAFRRIAVLKSHRIAAVQRSSAMSPTLSPREKELLLLLSNGSSNAEISRILAISVNTVKNHIRRILQKLNAANRTEAVTNYRQMDMRSQRNLPSEKPASDRLTAVCTQAYSAVTG
jgi:DNA-binding CsgD family transcriptional regulator